MKLTKIGANLYDYILDISLREHPVLAKLRQDTATHKLAAMQVSPEQAQFLQFLLKSINAKNVLEIGTFTGYSSLAMALALPNDGRVITCDINANWTKDADKYWRAAEQNHKIELKLAPALETLKNLLTSDKTEKFDFIFIDADKTNYVEYYELALELLDPQGIIAIDNVLWNGDVIDINNNNGQTREIRRLNSIVKNDTRVDISLLTIADGLFLIRKKREK